MEALIAGAVAASLATACGADDQGVTPVPTVPTVASTTEPDDATTDTGGDDSTDAIDGEDAGPDPSGDDGTSPDEDPAHLTTTTTTARPTGDLEEANVRFEEIASLNEPLALTTVPGDNHLWIAGRQGQIVRLSPTTGEVANEVLDLGGETVGRREQGLLGIAADETHLYVDYTDPAGDTHVESFALTDGGVDLDSRRELLFQEQPFSNHNGGGLVVDDSGYLYISLGDGGSGGDPLGSGQDPTTWLGSILRIDPTPGADEPYAIPADNPFADGVAGRPEIYLTGVRNPWRFTFDSLTGDLWVADVGQNAYEEVTLLLAANGAGLGANLGWNLREGLHEFSGPEPEGHVDPLYEYSHAEGVSVTGGYVYRGELVGELYGNYVFGDYQTARLWSLGISTGEVVFRDLDAPVPGGELASFGEGPDGELYALSLNGPVSRLLPG